MPSSDTATLTTGIKIARALWPTVGAVVTVTVSVLGAWYSTKLETQAQFASVQSHIEQQALTNSQTYATKAELSEITTTLQALMKTSSEIRADVQYMKGRIDQLMQ